MHLVISRIKFAVGLRSTLLNYPRSTFVYLHTTSLSVEIHHGVVNSIHPYRYNLAFQVSSLTHLIPGLTSHASIQSGSLHGDWNFSLSMEL